MSYLRNLVAASALALFTSGLVLAQTGGITGKATLQDGNPCVKCTVLIERLDIKGNYPVKTNKKGEYTYIGLPLGNYKITLQDSDGKTLFFFNNVRVGLGEPTQKDFDLAKEQAAAKKEQEANPEFKKQMEEQAKEQKQVGGAQQLFNEAKALEGSAQQLFNEAKVLEQQKNYPEARAKLEQEQRNYAEAAAKFEQALPLVKGQNLVTVLQNVANAYRMAKQYDKALDSYQKALQEKPDDVTLHDGLGNLYADMHKTAEAQQEFQKAADLNPGSASREYYNLGAIMYNQGKMDEAVQAFKKATEVDPKYADAYFLEGRALMGKLSMTPDGKMIVAPGTTEALQSYLQLAPNGQYAGEAKAMLETLQGQVQTEYKSTKKKKG